MDNNIDTIIGLNVNLKGNLQNSGSIQVNGSVEGELKSDEHINIGETAKVNGPVVAKTVEVSGQVTGLIEASDKLEIHPTGHVVGDINAPSLIIHQGATFIGQSSMPAKDGASIIKESVVIEPDKQEKTREADESIKEIKEEKAAEVEKIEDKKEEKNKKEETSRDPLGFFRK